MAFVKYNYRDGIFGSEFVGLQNFEFLAYSGKLWNLTKNTSSYNLAFRGVNAEGQEELVIVLINRGGERTFRLDLSGVRKYNYFEIYTTNENRDLEMTSSGTYEENLPFSIEEESIVTLRVIKK